MTDDATPYPLVIEPKEVAAIWGGDALVRRYRKPGEPSATLGESWECWDENRVRNGSLAGRSIGELRRELGTALVGGLDPERVFPILTKIIDARAPLSVQVHPDDAYAQRVERQPNGKTECWYILAAEADAELILGWTRDTDRDEYRRRVADGTLGDLLRRVPVRPGDAFYLPAGTLHAIGGGIQLFETQQASDLTYRIFDWNRLDANGKPRALHVDKAADVLDYRASRAAAIEPLEYELDGVCRVLLIAEPRFAVERWRIATSRAEVATDGMPLILTALDAPLQIACGADAVGLEPYATALIPAAAGTCSVRAIEGAAELLAIAPPSGGTQAYAERLERAGVARERIARFLAQFAPAGGASSLDSESRVPTVGEAAR